MTVHPILKSMRPVREASLNKDMKCATRTHEDWKSDKCPVSPPHSVGSLAAVCGGPAQAVSEQGANFSAQGPRVHPRRWGERVRLLTTLASWKRKSSRSGRRLLRYIEKPRSHGCRIRRKAIRNGTRPSQWRPFRWLLLLLRNTTAK